jgi:hypothetical protein
LIDGTGRILPKIATIVEWSSVSTKHQQMTFPNFLSFFSYVMVFSLRDGLA